MNSGGNEPERRATSQFDFMGLRKIVSNDDIRTVEGYLTKLTTKGTNDTRRETTKALKSKAFVNPVSFVVNGFFPFIGHSRLAS